MGRFLDMAKRFDGPSARSKEPCSNGPLSDGGPCNPHQPVRSVFWEGADGRIRGPAQVINLALAPDSRGRNWCWFCIDYQGSWRWVREDLLRNGGK